MNDPSDIPENEEIRSLLQEEDEEVLRQLLDDDSIQPNGVQEEQLDNWESDADEEAHSDFEDEDENDESSSSSTEEEMDVNLQLLQAASEGDLEAVQEIVQAHLQTTTLNSVDVDDDSDDEDLATLEATFWSDVQERRRIGQDEPDTLSHPDDVSSSQAIIQEQQEEVSEQQQPELDLNCEHPDTGVTPLGYASFYGHLAVVDFLTQQESIRINHCSSEGRTAFFLACQEGRTQVAQLLVLRGADIYTQCNGDMTALHACCGRGHLELLRFLANLYGSRYLQESIEAQSAFLLALRAESFQVLRYLITEKGVDPNAFERLGEEYLSPLCLAAGWGKVQMVSFLVECGASINLPSKDGNTPLVCACRTGDGPTVAYLLEHGADVSVSNGHGVTPLLTAIHSNQYETLRQLLKHGVNANDTQSIHACTPLFFAIMSCKLPAVKALVEYGAHLGVPDGHLSPLHAACRSGATDIVEYLVTEHPTIVNVTAVCREGENISTPLEIACQSKHFDIVQLLLQRHLELGILL